MVDKDKQVVYWRQGFEEDREVAQSLIDSGRIRHGLFFLHLSAEKLLKAIICARTGDLAPRMHNLIRLFEPRWFSIG
jgi:HEPN domain-containing protein